MNFQTVEAANGELATMFGTFVEVGGGQETESGKLKAVCKIRDDVGITHKVHIHQGNGELPTVMQLNLRCQFSISTFAGSYQGKPYTGYSGFWNSQTQVAPQTQQQAPQNIPQGGRWTPPQGRQALSRPQQQPNAKKDVDWDAISRGKVRHGVVCAFIQGGVETYPKLNIRTVEHWVDYIMTGQDPDLNSEPDPSTQETEGDYPF